MNEVYRVTIKSQYASQLLQDLAKVNAIAVEQETDTEIPAEVQEEVLRRLHHAEAHPEQLTTVDESILRLHK